MGGEDLGCSRSARTAFPRSTEAASEEEEESGREEAARPCEGQEIVRGLKAAAQAGPPEAGLKPGQQPIRPPGC